MQANDNIGAEAGTPSPIAPPTEPGPRPKPLSVEPMFIGIMSLILATIESLILAYISYIYWLNMSAWSGGLRSTAGADLLVRVASIGLLLCGAIALLNRDRSGLRWLCGWSAISILWPPILSVAFLAQGEVPVGLALVLVCLTIAGAAGAAGVFLWPMMAMVWLTLPIAMLLWCKRCRRLNLLKHVSV